MTGRIFISYRHEGSSGDAGRLRDYLKEVFGPHTLFIDSDMPIGVKFKDHLHDQLNECGVFLAIIGRNWLNACDEDGHRRLDDADDWVRVEIASALARGIKVVPVIIDDGVIPKPSDLPSDLKSLPEFQAFRVRNNQFERDSAALADKLREALGQTNAPTANEERLIKSIVQKYRSLITERPRFWKALGILGVIFLMMLGGLAYHSGDRILSQWFQREEDVKSETPTIEPKPSVLEENAKSIGRPPSKPTLFGRSQSRPAPLEPPPFGQPQSRPAPAPPRPPPPRPPLF